jgi:PAS domain S-box-containing protein
MGQVARLPLVPASRVQPHRQSFRRLVLFGTLGVVLAAMGLFGGLMEHQTRELAGDLARSLLGQKLGQVRARVTELLGSAERQGRTCLQLTPPGGLKESDYLRVFAQLAPAFMQQAEFTYLGYAAEQTGDYAMLERFSERDFRLRIYASTASGVREIRDYRFERGEFVLVKTNPWDQYDPRARPFYLAAKAARRPVWTQTYVFRANEHRAEVPGVTHAVPVIDPSGALQGVWDVDFDTYALADFLKTKSDPQSGYAFVLEERDDGERMLIAHPDLTKVMDERRQLVGGRQVRDPVVGAFLNAMKGQLRPSRPREAHPFEWAGEDYLSSYEAIGSDHGPAWLLAVVMPRSYAAARLDESRSLALLFGLGVTAVVVLLAAWLAGLLATPVERLRVAADGLAEDSDPQPVKVEGPYELARLAEAFNTMLASVEVRRRELLAANLRLQEEVRQRRQREAELEAVFSNAPVGIWVTDLTGRYTLQSERLRERFGDCRGKTPEELDLPPALQEQYSLNNRRALAGEVVHGETAENIGGVATYFHWIVAPIRMGGLVTGALGVSIDVSERRRAEDALLRSQQRLRLHLENTPMAVIDWSADFTVLSWNAAAETIFGWTASEAIGRHGLFVVPEAERGAVREVWSELVQRRGGFRNYNQNVTHDGRVIDCEWYNTVLTDEHDQIIGVSSLVLDVSERIGAETLYRESEERFIKSFSDSSAAKLLTRRVDGRIVDVNKRFAQVMNCRREDVIGRTTIELNFWRDPAERTQLMNRLERDGEVRDYECKLYPRNSAPVEVVVSMVAVPLGADLCLLTTFVDDSERQAAVRALQESQRFMSTLISRLPGMVYRCRNDEEWTMTFVSDGAKELTGYEPAEIEHNRLVSFASLIHVDDRARVWQETQRAVAAGMGEFSYEYRILHRSGEVRWVWERGEGRYDAESGATTLIGFVTDITERKLAEEEVLKLNLSLEKRVADRTGELAAANDKLKELDRLKSEFLATMSHELRTPLNSIIGFSALLHRGAAGALNDEQQKQIGLVNNSARHLLTLINDLLDLSRIESGRMELFPEEVSIGDVLAEVEATLAPMTSHKNLRYTTFVPSPPPRLVTDRKRLFQIVLNLANNAVKFTEQGGVTVDCTRLGDGLRISVQDTGIGIKPEHLPMLFEAFRQIDGSARRVYEGTGLGLHLCRKLLDLLGGHIEVRSEAGRGSCFAITLPANASSGGKDGVA